MCVYSTDELVYILESLLKTELLSTSEEAPPPSEPAATTSTASPSHAYRCLCSDTAGQLVRASIQIHTKLGTMFLATPDRLHYRFTLKDLTAVFRYVNTVCHWLVSPTNQKVSWLSSLVPKPSSPPPPCSIAASLLHYNRGGEEGLGTRLKVSSFLLSYFF